MGKATRRKKGPTHKKPKLAKGYYAGQTKGDRQNQGPGATGTDTAPIVAALAQ